MLHHLSRRSITAVTVVLLYVGMGETALLALQGRARAQNRVIRTFRLTEEFNVSHPRQLVELDCPQSFNAASSSMLGPDGNEVPYQLLSSGNVLIETDLPAGAAKVYQLVSGSAPNSTARIQLTTQNGFHEITNGITGVRIARPDRAGNLALSPIQGIRLRDGSWTGTGPNLLTLPQGSQILSVSTKVIENGPLRVVVEVAYECVRPDLRYGNQLLIPGGRGFFRSTLQVDAGQPAVLVEDDTDMDLSYGTDVYSAIHPTQLRYRGHSAQTVELGREVTGIAYRPNHERGDSDAFRDVPQDRPLVPSYRSAPGELKYLLPWDMWASGGGRYWLMYDMGASDSAPVIGIFSGQASRTLGPGSSGPAFYSTPTGQKAAGIRYTVNRRGPDASVTLRSRAHWGIFIGTKGPDLGDPLKVQTIQAPLNLYGGFSLTKILRIQTAYPDPSGGWSSMYMSAAQTQNLIQRVRSDETYRNWLYNADPGARELLDIWRDGTGKKAHDAVVSLEALATKALDTYINGNGIYAVHHSYWQGGLAYSRAALTASSLLSDTQLNQADRARLKAVLALFGGILWDNDYVPLFDGHRLNMGTANMPLQQLGYRFQYTLLLQHHPQMAGGRLQTATDMQLEGVYAQINNWGAHMGSPHYMGASMGPTLSMLQQVKTAGLQDPFRDEPRLTSYGEFLVNLQTPPEPRFGGLRKLICYGDGSTEATELAGQLGTCLSDAAPTTSQRLMQSWDEQGKPHSSFHATTVLKIDDTLPRQNLVLNSATYPGYYSVVRHGSGTAYESAAWVINGNWYRDHRHNDTGALAIYALSAPLAVNWSSIYYPATPGAYQHSTILPESSIGRAWDGDDVPLESGVSPFTVADQDSFESFLFSSRSVSRYRTANGTEWLRSVRLLAGNPSIPVFTIDDEFTGPDSEATKVFSLNQMAEAEVDTPQGRLVPPLRFWNNSDSNQRQLPSAGPVQTLQEGWNRFGFSGQWKIDWDLFTLSDGSQQFLLGNWSHNWNPTTEGSQFQAANGRAFRERQNMLRIRGKGSFHTIILPRPKDDGGNHFSLREGGPGQVLLESPRAKASLSAAHYAYQDQRRTVVSSFVHYAVDAYDIHIEGGPSEVVLEVGKATVTLHGAGGERRIRLPGKYRVPESVRVEDGLFVVDFNNLQPLRLTFDAVEE